MQFKKYITLLASALLLFACAKEEFDTPTSTPDGPVTVGFWVGRGDTRTETPNAGFEMDAPLGAETTRTHASSFGNNKLSISWSNGDQVAMWAKPAAATEEATFTFSNQTFKNWFVSADSQNAYFTTTLDNAMPAKNENNEDITYNYYVCYPTPASANGTITTFTIPSTQDGKMGGGADIMMAQGSGIALQSLDSDGDFVIDKPENYPSFTMKHLIHSLMFYVPAGEHWGFPDNETIERIVFTMPSSAAATGTVTADATADTPALSTPTNGSNTIALNLTGPIGPSSGNDLDFAAASIIPGTYKGDLTVKVYSQTKASQVTFSGIDRNMAANRVTPVVLNCNDVRNQYVLRIKWGGNNLGEAVNTITFHDANGTEITPLTITDVANKFKNVGDYYDIDLTFSNETSINTIKALSGQNITVKYDSNHAIVSSSFVFPSDIANGFYHEETLTVPYLLYQDFSEINTFGNDDGYTAESKSDRNIDGELLNISGWNAARAGGSAGNSVRINVRYQSGAWVVGRYAGRLDTPSLSGLKNNNAKIKVTFDAGCYIPLGYNTDDRSRTDVVQLKIGIHTNSVTSAINGASDDSSIGKDIDELCTIKKSFNYFENKFSNDSYDEKFDTYSFTIEDGSVSSSTRLVWFPWTTQTSSKFAANNAYYIYLDNIKVQIVSE